MSSFYIVAETFAGGGVEECVRDLAKFASRMGVWVKCDVNGIEVLTPPDASPETMWRNYEKARDRRATFVSLNVIPAGTLNTTPS
jgi:hypothetical protein